MKMIRVSYSELMRYKASRDSRAMLWTWSRFMQMTTEVWHS